MPNPRHAAPRATLTEADEELELTMANVDMVLDELRPYLMADGGNVELVEIKDMVVYLRCVAVWVHGAA